MFFSNFEGRSREKNQIFRTHKVPVISFSKGMYSKTLQDHVFFTAVPILFWLMKKGGNLKRKSSNNFDLISLVKCTDLLKLLRMQLRNRQVTQIVKYLVKQISRQKSKLFLTQHDFWVRRLLRLTEAESNYFLFLFSSVRILQCHDTC